MRTFTILVASLFLLGALPLVMADHDIALDAAPDLVVVSVDQWEYEPGDEITMWAIAYRHGEPWEQDTLTWGYLEEDFRAMIENVTLFHAGKGEYQGTFSVEDEGFYSLRDPSDDRIGYHSTRILNALGQDSFRIIEMEVERSFQVETDSAGLFSPGETAEVVVTGDDLTDVELFQVGLASDLGTPLPFPPEAGASDSRKVYSLTYAETLGEHAGELYVSDGGNRTFLMLFDSQRVNSEIYDPSLYGLPGELRTCLMRLDGSLVGDDWALAPGREDPDLRNEIPRIGGLPCWEDPGVDDLWFHDLGTGASLWYNPPRVIEVDRAGDATIASFSALEAGASLVLDGHWSGSALMLELATGAGQLDLVHSEVIDTSSFIWEPQAEHLEHDLYFLLIDLAADPAREDYPEPASISFLAEPLADIHASQTTPKIEIQHLAIGAPTSFEITGLGDGEEVLLVLVQPGGTLDETTAPGAIGNLFYLNTSHDGDTVHGEFILPGFLPADGSYDLVFLYGDFETNDISFLPVQNVEVGQSATNEFFDETDAGAILALLLVPFLFLVTAMIAGMGFRD